MDKLALNMLRMIFLFQAIIFGGLATLTTDPDRKTSFEMKSLSGWTLFGNPDMLPEEMTIPMMFAMKVLIIGIPLGVTYKILKMLLGG